MALRLDLFAFWANRDNPADPAIDRVETATPIAVTAAIGVGQPRPRRPCPQHQQRYLKCAVCIKLRHDLRLRRLHADKQVTRQMFESFQSGGSMCREGDLPRRGMADGVNIGCSVGIAAIPKEAAGNPAVEALASA